MFQWKSVALRGIKLKGLAFAPQLAKSGVWGQSKKLSLRGEAPMIVRVFCEPPSKTKLRGAPLLGRGAGYKLRDSIQFDPVQITACAFNLIPFKSSQWFAHGHKRRGMEFSALTIGIDYFKPKTFGADKIDDLVAKAPSVVLTKEEHKVITNKLNAFWRDVKREGWGPAEVKKKLIEHYQKVYRDHPHWLQSIQHLLIQLP